MNKYRRPWVGGVILSICVCLAVQGCGGGSGEYTAQLIAGPFLSTVTQDSATITWQTDKKEKAVVEYGPIDSYGKKASGQITKVTLGTGDFYLNTVSIGGLEPVTWTHYRIGSLEQPSPDFRFRTAPAPGGDFSFVVYGDSRPNLPIALAAPDDTIHQEILNQIQELAPDFVVNTGDLVAEAEDPAEWEHFFSILGSLTSTIAYHPVFGECDRGGEAVASGFFGTPSNIYYSFDYGDSHFTVINTSADFSPQSVQYDWLGKDLSEAKQREGITRLFAFMHAPAYCSSSVFADDQEVKDAREYLAPLFKNQGVKMVFQGHVPIYERTKAIDGVVYLVTGGGGTELVDAGLLHAQPWTIYKETANHFIEMSMGSNHITMKAKYKDGTVIDTANY